VNQLRAGAEAYRRYVTSGCERQYGARWFSAWLEAGQPASMKEWQDALAAAAADDRARAARRGH
jgi:hypothetical protein